MESKKITMNGMSPDDAVKKLTADSDSPRETPATDVGDTGAEIDPFLAEVTGNAPCVTIAGMDYPIKAHIPALIMLQARRESRKGAGLTVGTNSLDLLDRFATAIFGADVLDSILDSGVDLEQLGQAVSDAMRFYFPSATGSGKSGVATPPLT